MQESILIIAMMLRHFNLQFDDPGYQLQITQNLSIKPKDFFIRASLRDGVDATALEKILAGTSITTPIGTTISGTSTCSFSPIRTELTF